MSDKTPEPATRRTFMRMCLVGGSAVTVAGVLWSSRKRRADRPDGLRRDAIPVKNPAFLKRSSSNGPILYTNTPDGKRIAFRLNAESEYIWDRIVNVREYHNGKRLTVEQLLEIAVQRFRNLPAASVRRDCRAFLDDAYQNSVIMTEDRYVVSTFRERKS